ncbi:MAG: hypothetical protein AAF657_06225 [Acidobacteriota bacterium]
MRFFATEKKMNKTIRMTCLLGLALAATAQAEPVEEDQTGAAFPSVHRFYDRLDYDAGLEVPQLSSNPGASTTIYLDFNGDDVSKGADIFKTSCFKKGQDLEYIDENDRERIYDVFAQVAESFSPFDVNVTTILLDFLAVPPGQRTWALCTEDHVRGVGGGFSLKDDNPALFPFPAGPIATHEVGHSFGMFHAGVRGPGEDPFCYYNAHSSGISGFARWNAFMGNTRLGEMFQWTNGDYLDSYQDGSTQPVDNLGHISNHSPYRPDDHGTDMMSATPLSSGATMQGIIADDTDKDFFVFTSGPGTLTIDALSLAARPMRISTPTGPVYGRTKPALDLKIELFDDTGWIAESNPVSRLDAEIEVEVVVPGTYYVSVEGVGVGDPLNSPPSGYVGYGSIGSYSIRASFNSSTTPDLQVTRFESELYNPCPTDPNCAHIKNLEYSGQIKNFGTAEVSTLGRLQIYKHYEPDLSDPNAAAPPFETLEFTPSYWVGVHVEGIPIYVDTDDLQAGDFDELLVIDTEHLPDGIYYLYAYSDDPNAPGGDAVEESNELNNVMVLDVNPSVPGAQGYVLDRSGG